MENCWYGVQSIAQEKYQNKGKNRLLLESIMLILEIWISGGWLCERASTSPVYSILDSRVFPLGHGSMRDPCADAFQCRCSGSISY